MATWIALLRGINVGGNNILPMKDLRILLEEAGLAQVKTYIQSGNCVFQSVETDAHALEQLIGATIFSFAGFQPQVLVISQEAYRAALSANPYEAAGSDPKSVHFFFLASPATAPDLAALDAMRADSERFHLTDQVLYLHAPDGIGRSKLAAQAERHLGVATTARNFRSVMKIAELADAK